jgi:hypothetical protein
MHGVANVVVVLLVLVIIIVLRGHHVGHEDQQIEDV